ncbi:MAG TPA: 2Fe-2S iron-sulfur cluster-binding protein [Bdellovibrionales bacterium]|nr:2Fe-2S iron-sulfur cluster-binding protein [Bdellovibrionales bacterium]
MTFSPFEHLSEFEGTPTVLELAIRDGLPLNHSCGGMGTCGTCCVVVESDPSELPARNEIEAEMAGDRGFTARERLACQLTAYPRLIVKIR